jgi:hypothetical protein
MARPYSFIDRIINVFLKIFLIVMDETNGKILALNIGRGLVFLNKIKKL